jgi:outer membrane protein TolC
MKSLHLCSLLAVLSATACQSASEYAADADEAVYSLVDQRRDELFEAQSGFEIEPDPNSLRQRILRGEVEGGVRFDLVTCLRIAAENNREYQARKESLFLAAMNVTLERWLLGWRPSLTGDAAINGIGSAADTQSAGLSFQMRKILGTGAEIVGGIGLSVFKTVGGGSPSTTSNIGLAITQPLLRGSGSRIVYEPLTQSERDLIYEVRSFERFRRSFAVEVTTRMLRLLEQADSIRNEELNVENLKLLRERNEALAEAGRTSDIEVDQARQDEVRSQNRLVVSRAELQASYDSFLLFLGLPIATPIDVDLEELDRLYEDGLTGIDYDEDTVLRFAHAHRLDYMTSLDQVSDAERKTLVAAEALRTGLDLRGNVDLTSKEGKPLEFDLNDAAWEVGLGIDLPVSRIPERNFYRASLINLEVAQRDAEEFKDTITTDLRSQLRNTVTARETFDIQNFSAQLAERRVESAQLNLQAGRASTRDILEAQQDLLDSRNLVTGALIDYWLARLQLFRDMELIEVDEDGIRFEQERIDEMIAADAATEEVDA